MGWGRQNGIPFFAQEEKKPPTASVCTVGARRGGEKKIVNEGRRIRKQKKKGVKLFSFRAEEETKGKPTKSFFFLFLDSIVIHRHCCACCAVAKLSFLPAAKPANWSNFPKKSSEDSREGNRNGGKKNTRPEACPGGESVAL